MEGFYVTEADSPVLRQHVYNTAEKIRLGFRTRAGKDRYSKQPVQQRFKEV